MLRNAIRNWLGTSGADASPKPLAFLVDNADRGRLLRHVQPDLMRHRNLRWCKPPGTCPDRGTIDPRRLRPRLPEVHTCPKPVVSAVGSRVQFVTFRPDF